MDNPSTQSTPQSPGSGDPADEAVLRAATAPLREVAGDRVRVGVERLNRVGGWAFLQGKMHGPDGGRPSFSGTSYEKPAAAGQMSDVYVALLKESDQDGAGWQVCAHAIGPSDLAWENWPRDHAAPLDLFR